MIVDWRPVAKDGADLPLASHRPHLARQTIAVGETYDFEYTPTHAGRCKSKSAETAASVSCSRACPFESSG